MKLIDLTGQHFGRLTVIGRGSHLQAGKYGGNAYATVGIMLMCWEPI